jgi:phage anti-repressor protein
MLQIYEIGDKKLINSVELYKKLGLHHEQYARWYKNNIIYIGEEEIDYLDKDKNPGKFPLSGIKQGRHPKEFYVSIIYAHGLCMVAKTSKAKKIRLWLSSNFALKI